MERAMKMMLIAMCSLPEIEISTALRFAPQVRTPQRSALVGVRVLDSDEATAWSQHEKTSEAYIDDIDELNMEFENIGRGKLKVRSRAANLYHLTACESRLCYPPIAHSRQMFGVRFDSSGVGQGAGTVDLARNSSNVRVIPEDDNIRPQYVKTLDEEFDEIDDLNMDRPANIGRDKVKVCFRDGNKRAGASRQARTDTPLTTPTRQM